MADNGELGLAMQRAEELVALEPYRESAYGSLVDLNVACGNRAEALRVYERCLHRLREDLGVAPPRPTFKPCTGGCLWSTIPVDPSVCPDLRGSRCGRVLDAEGSDSRLG